MVDPSIRGALQPATTTIFTSHEGRIAQPFPSTGGRVPRRHHHRLYLLLVDFQGDSSRRQIVPSYPRSSAPEYCPMGVYASMYKTWISEACH